MTITIHEGHWNQVLAGAECDLLITNLTQPIWNDVCLLEFVEAWSPRTRGWMLGFAVDEEIMVWRAAFRGCGRDDLRAIPCVPQSSCGRTVYLMAGRPQTTVYLGWPAPSWYWYRRAGSPLDLELLRAIISDFSRPGERVIDPCAGAGDTLIAAAGSGRIAIGAERNPEACAEARARIAGQPADDGEQLPLFSSNR